MTNKQIPREFETHLVKFCFSAYQIKGSSHRHIKRIINPMLGFKSFVSAKATIAKIELHHMLKKGQIIESANMPIWKLFYSLAG